MIGRVMILFVVLVIVSVVSGQNNTTDATTAAPGAATTPSVGVSPLPRALILICTKFKPHHNHIAVT